MATLAARLTSIWEESPGLASWTGTVDHKRIGKRYIYTSFAFFVIAGLQSLVMRVQLARPDQHLVSPEVFNQLFSMHGITMIFLFATPMLSGFGNYFVPLMIGARDMAFPRLNAFGYWVFLAAGLFMYFSFFMGAIPDDGWFNYVPLAGSTFTPERSIDFYGLGILFLAISSTVGAINFIVTIFKMRAPGMTLNRMPLYVWAILATSMALVFALPALSLANIMLELDRKFGMHFFDAGGGGDPLLWQHLFWIFGHPDVYIILLPAVGIVSSIVPVFTRRPMVGYAYVALATVITFVLSFGVWVHHMFATGLPQLSMSFFAAATIMFTIPGGVQVFAWVATIVMARKIVLKTPMLFILGFLSLFVMGGVTGIMFAIIPFDRQVTDTYFVVAHFHYVLFGGAVFPIFAGFYYWLPKITGRLLNERLGRWSFWLMFSGFNITFGLMHVVGLLGMPRRVYTYLPGLGWDIWNMLETVGSFVLTLGILLTAINWYRSARNGELAGDDPWGGETLEWATTSPPPAYNFERIPIVASPHPLWDESAASAGTVSAELAEGHQTLGTSVLDAEPDQVMGMPGETHAPLLLTLALTALFFAFLFDAWFVAAVAGLGVAGAIVQWLWPHPHEGAH
ncbi:MAG: cytochrome c oxidase subunit [Actinomycetota bacterium]|nr:cytochrome c oxidase subunit [Actinomycetota bacterium]